MTAYLIAKYDIENPEEHLRYVLAAEPLLEKHAGEVLVADDQAKTIEGNGGGVGVVVQFKSEAAAMNFYNDPEYRSLKQIRLGSTKNVTIVLATSPNQGNVEGQEK